MLTQLAQGVYAWLADAPGPGRPNGGGVVDPDGVTVIDSLLAPAQATPFAAAVAELGLPVRRLVLTSSHIEFVGGTTSFPLPAIYGTPQTSALLDQPPTPEVYRRLYPEWAAHFDEELRTRPVTHVIAEAAAISAAAAAVPAGGESVENLVVALPEAGVVFAGAMASFGVAPLAFAGDPAAWADALDEVVALAPVVVPGHGPVGGADEVAELQGYLRACVAANGDPNRVASGPWDRWPGRHHDEVNVERAAMLARGDTAIPPSMLRAAGLA